jgi:hypothetical protein
VEGWETKEEAADFISREFVVKSVSDRTLTRRPWAHEHRRLLMDLYLAIHERGQSKS